MGLNAGPQFLGGLPRGWFAAGGGPAAPPAAPSSAPLVEICLTVFCVFVFSIHTERKNTKHASLRCSFLCGERSSRSMQTDVHKDPERVGKRTPHCCYAVQPRWCSAVLPCARAFACEARVVCMSRTSESCAICCRETSACRPLRVVGNSTKTTSSSTRFSAAKAVAAAPMSSAAPT